MICIFMIFAKRVSLLKPSPTISISAQASEMIANGIDVIDLSVGDPVLDESYVVPDSIKQAAIESINANKIGYTPSNGLPILRKSIIEKISRDNQIHYEMNEVAVGCGAKQMIFNGLFATINPGDEVIIIAPYWVSYPAMVELCEGKPVIISTTSSNSFKLADGQLEGAITDRTKCIILNSPSNPTGAIYNKEDLIKIADVLRKYPNILIMTDDIYEYLIFDKKTPYVHLLNVAPDLKDRVLMINSVANSHAMTGWRIGFAAGERSLIKVLNDLQSQSTSNPCTISQYATVAALQDGKNTSTKIVPLLKERRDIVTKALSTVDGLDVFNPDGAFYVFVSIEGFAKKHNTSCVDFAKILLDKANVAVVPGIAFGAKNCFRISLTISTKRLSEAVTRIVNALSELQ